MTDNLSTQRAQIGHSPVDSARTYDAIHFGPFLLIEAERLLLKEGISVAIGGRAFDLLAALVDRAGSIVSAHELRNIVWPQTFVEDANLRVWVAALRKILGEGEGAPRYIVNVPGRGYAFVAPVVRSIAGAPVSNGVPDEYQHSASPLPLSAYDNDTHTPFQHAPSRPFVRIVVEVAVEENGTIAEQLASVLQKTFGVNAATFACIGSSSAK